MRFKKTSRLLGQLIKTKYMNLTKTELILAQIFGAIILIVGILICLQG